MKIVRHQTRLVLTIVGIILALSVLLFFMILPLLSKVTETQNAIKENEVKLAQIAAEIANYKSLSENLSKVEKTKQTLTKMFPIREVMVGLVEGMESATGRAGMEQALIITDRKEKEFASKSGGKEKAPPPLVSGLNRLEEVPYELKVIGDWRQLTNFFLYMENLPYVTIPDTVTFTSDKIQVESSTQGLKNKGTAAAKLNGAFYILSE